MPPLRPIPADITSLTNEELMDQLLQHNYKPGPILPSTRSVYERKLFQLRTGQEATVGYEPVDDDDEGDQDADEDSGDEEVVLQRQQPRQRMTKSTRTEVRKTPPRQPVMSRYAEGPSTANRSQSAYSKRETSSTSSKAKGGLPLWVKLLAILVVATLVFLVIKNMETDPASEVPDIPEQVEFNV